MLRDRMRDLVFKNITSVDKHRRVISSSEIVDKQGVHSVIHRHFICVVKEVEDKKLESMQPALFVVKERNTREQIEKFFCRIKGSMYAVSGSRLFLIAFMHSLKIHLTHIDKVIS